MIYEGFALNLEAQARACLTVFIPSESSTDRACVKVLAKPSGMILYEGALFKPYST